MKVVSTKGAAAVRVLHVLTSDNRRGAESFASALASALDGPGCRSHSIALSSSRTRSPLDVEVIGTRARSLRTLLRLRSEMRTADVVVAHGSKTLSACWLAGLGLKRRTIYKTIGDPRYWANSPGRRARLGFLLRRMDAIAAQSSRTATILRQDFGIRDERITVIGNGRAASRFPRADSAVRAAARQIWELDPERPIAATVGSLSPEKRLDVAIKAMANLPAFELLVAGDGIERASLERLAARHAPGRVRFLGAVDDPAAVLAASDVVLLTSDSEGLPGALIEAGLVGRPSVATDVGFVSDIVRDGVTGLLVPPGDADAVAVAVGEAYRRRTELGDAAFDWTTEQFEFDGIVDRWRVLLDEMARPDGPQAIRVLHIINSLQLSGGAENSMVQTLPALTRHGVESRVIALSSPAGQGAEALRRHGIEVLEAAGDSIRQFMAVRREIGRFGPAVVHTTLFHAGVIGRLAAASARTPAVTSWVNTSYNDLAMASARSTWKKRVVKLTDRALYRWATAAVHTLTEASAASIVTEMKVSRRRVTVIPRGRDRAVMGERTEARRQAVRARLGIPLDAPLLLNVGRQERQKGQVGLVAAFAKVRAQRPDAVLLIAGRPGVASTDLARAIEMYGLTQSVRLLGQRSDVPDLLCAADVFVFSSLWEGLGCAVLEAMAMEVPVVSYDVAAVAEVLGGTASLVPIGDEDALARAVLELLESRDDDVRLRTRLARERFEEQYSVSRVAEATAHWYGRFDRRRSRA